MSGCENNVLSFFLMFHNALGGTKMVLSPHFLEYQLNYGYSYC